MSITALFHPRGREITGVERDPEEPELVRAYIGPRCEWRFLLAEGAEAERLEAMWSDPTCRLTTIVPEGAPVYHDAEGQRRAREEADREWQRRLDGSVPGA